MANYGQVYGWIKEALSLRPYRTLVQVAKHEKAEIALLNYIEAVRTIHIENVTRNAHVNATAGVACDLVWDTIFRNTSYDFSVAGFTAEGYPMEVTLISKTREKITVRTLVDGTLTALAKAYAIDYEEEIDPPVFID